tara:strand:- start:1156 stop:1479 length:324 start_codon:yes stop_codon:yes gene_type:complete
MKKIIMNNQAFTKRDDVIAFGFEAKRIAKEFETIGKPALVEDMTSKGLLVHSAGIATAIIKEASTRDTLNKDNVLAVLAELGATPDQIKRCFKTTNVKASLTLKENS